MYLQSNMYLDKFINQNYAENGGIIVTPTYHVIAMNKIACRSSTGYYKGNTERKRGRRTKIEQEIHIFNEAIRSHQ